MTSMVQSDFSGFTENIEPWFPWEWMNYPAMRGRFAFFEYWRFADGEQMKEWLELTGYRAAIYDWYLQDLFKEMCEGNGAFDMEELSHGALIYVCPERAVTFVESHDEIRPFGGDNEDKMGIEQDKPLAYAFIIMSEGHPCVFRQDYIDAPYADEDPPADSIDDGWTGDPLKPFIDPLIDARRKFAGGTTTYLSTANKSRLYIAKRNGTAEKDGCILVLNNHLSQTLTNTVDTGWSQGTVLVDVLQTNHTVEVQAGGMAPLSASNRFYRVYVRRDAL